MLKKGFEFERVSQTVVGIPRSHWHCSFYNLELEEKTWQKVVGWMDAARGSSPHLLLTGPPGTGKTHLSVALYRWAVLQFDISVCRWLHIPSFYDRVYSAWKSGNADYIFNDLEGLRFLVLDDLFGRPMMRSENQNLFRLVDIMSRSKAALVVTDNHDVSEWEKFGVDTHEMSRLMERAVGLRLEGPDRR